MKTHESTNRLSAKIQVGLFW